MRRAQLGSVAAFETLVVRHGPRLHRYLRVELRHESDAHDALQEAVDGSLARASRTPPRGPLLAVARRHRVAQGRRYPAPAGRTVEAESAAESHDDDLLLETREALSALPPQYREVLLLRYLLGLSEEEAAAALGVRVGTIKSRSSRARRALLEELG